MKCGINLVIALIVINFGSFELCASYVDSASFPDDYIVNDIKTKTNLTMNDVKRMKFLWLGFLTEPIKYAATIYAGTFFGAEGYMQTQQYPEGVKNVFSYLSAGYQPQESMVSNIQQWLPLGVGVLGAGVAGAAAYNFLYPRIHSGILDMVQKYAYACEPLVVASRTFDNMDVMNRAINATEGNAQWGISNIIAKYNGMHNLIGQASVAQQLCDLLGKDVVDKEELCHEIGEYKNNLENNIKLIVDSDDYKAVKAHRDNGIAQKNVAAMNAARLAQIQAQAGALQAGKIGIYWNIAASFVEKSFSAAKYLFENRGMIAGALAATVFGVYVQPKFAGIFTEQK